MDHEETEELTDAIQRFVGIATPVVRIASAWGALHPHPMGARGLVDGLDWSDGSERCPGTSGDRRAAGPPLRGGDGAHRPIPALLQKLPTLELYLRPRRTPDVSDLGLPLVRLARGWIVSGAFGRNTRGKTKKALDAAERLDVSSLAGRARTRG